MSFVSYSQNFEDVMLWRALQHISNGFYIDIGAEHPVINSVSKAFYDAGWRGVHVEPTPQYAQLLRANRPDETVLEIALADVDGQLRLNVFPDTGLSTAVDAFANQHIHESGYSCTPITVPARTMATAFAPYQHSAVHWLKIDVEGFEQAVLQGWDSGALRPWIMVIEATIPNSQQTNHHLWEEIVLNAHYEFVYFDGLNRFYIAKEHPELKAAFYAPPNVFDNFVLKNHLDHARDMLLSEQHNQA